MTRFVPLRIAGATLTVAGATLGVTLTVERPKWRRLMDWALLVLGRIHRLCYRWWDLGAEVLGRLFLMRERSGLHDALREKSFG